MPVYIPIKHTRWWLGNVSGVTANGKCWDVLYYMNNLWPGVLDSKPTASMISTQQKDNAHLYSYTKPSFPRFPDKF